MDEPTFEDRMAKIAELMDGTTLGDWRVVPSERPTIYTDVSQNWKPESEVWYFAEYVPAVWDGKHWVDDNGRLMPSGLSWYA